MTTIEQLQQRLRGAEARYIDEVRRLADAQADCARRRLPRPDAAAVRCAHQAVQYLRAEIRTMTLNDARRRALADATVANP